ncbi:MAG TPA: sugar phosphate isomerase/epimerase family protein [Terriglobia bacterium]|nr:sugar phosphate isomerase/epimerase family protein [Terriglobia bacterium]
MPNSTSRRQVMEGAVAMAGTLAGDLSSRTFRASAFKDGRGASADSNAISSDSQTLVGKVHKAVQLRMLPKQLSYAERFNMARDASFHYVEANTVTDLQEADEIKKSADAANIKIHGVTNGLWTELPLSSPDSSIVSKRLDAVRTSLCEASLYGGSTVLVVPALVTPAVSYHEAWVRSQKNLRSVIPFAAEQKVVIAVEEVWNKFLLSPVEFAAYVDEFKSPWLKAYFDVGNVMPFGYPQDWIRALGGRIAKIHLKDYDPKTRHFVNLGEGTVDWKAVRQALIDVGYSGIVTTELAPGPESYLRDLSGRIDQLLLY